jgi:predicted DCC family thiol-disulfide oxidoreductase YuxK
LSHLHFDLPSKSCRCKCCEPRSSEAISQFAIQITMNEETKHRKIILFDGVCNLCNGSVIFILDREKQPMFKFASIQSEAGKELLRYCGLPSDFSQAVILIDNERIYFGSAAALKIGQYLKFPWSILSYIGLVVPRFMRDWVYNQIAQHRYQWFGKKDVCMIPTEELRTRFR